MSESEKPNDEERNVDPLARKKPMTQEEEIEALRKWQEAEDRHNERWRAMGKIARLSQERGKALQNGDKTRVEELTQEIDRVGREIVDRYGY